MPLRPLAALLAITTLALSQPVPAAPPQIAWQKQWSAALFAQAAREHRFVLLDLHAVWCHWCHVMDEETYADSQVSSLIDSHYLAVSIDADSDPALASRYGDWGWPATIVLAADGTEIVKRRGFIAPRQMAVLLQAIVDDPTPGPSVGQPDEIKVAHSAHLSESQHATLMRAYDEAYDARYGGWGSGQKFLDAPTMEYTLSLVLVSRDAKAERRARQTLDANLQLIDAVWGGVYQYSATADWSSPHYEKLLSFQADDLRLYSEAYARWREPRYLHAARALERYMLLFLRSPEGAFYVSQDADLSPQITGHEYYAHDEATRRRLGIPAIDVHEYARENGWAIRALTRFYDVTGDTDALAAAERAASWVSVNRGLTGGGFSHDAGNAGGPFLDDTLSMGQAFLALYRSSGERTWLRQSRAALDYIATHFRDPRGGYFTAPAPPGAKGVFRQSARAVDANVELARFANLLQHYTGADEYRADALHAMRFLAAANTAGSLQSGILLADYELGGSPVHIAVVGGKADPAARSLHAAALGFPAPYLQIDWWDRAEGALPNAQVRYPQLARAAAFACTGASCSLPVFDPAELGRTIDTALYQ
jgi:uncharacterized protein YyaL (SSP411 family)